MIEKATAGELINLNIHYDVISRESVQALAEVNSDALAIWIFMMSMPSTWVPRKKHIRDVLSISENRYRVAMRDLKKLKLVVAEKTRGENGKFIGGGLSYYAIPYEELPGDNNPCCGETDIAVDGLHIETENIKETEINRKEREMALCANNITEDNLIELVNLRSEERIHPNQIKGQNLVVLISAMGKIKQYADERYEDFTVSINSMNSINWSRCDERLYAMADIGVKSRNDVYECLKYRLINAKRSGANIVNTIFLLGTESDYHGLESIEFNDDFSESMKEDTLRKVYSFHAELKS